MFQTVKENEKVHRDINEKALKIAELCAKRQSLEKENAKMLNELKQLKADFSTFEENQDILSCRNTVMREKFNKIDENVKEGADKIKDEMKTYFKKLGVDVQLVSVDRPENLVELKIQFSETRDYHATFIYDPITEDYDLTSLHPEHPRFPELRKFLQETKDVQGFLFNFRKLMLRSVTRQN